MINIETLKKNNLINIGIETKNDFNLTKEITDFLRKNIDVFFVGIGKTLIDNGVPKFNQEAIFITDVSYDEGKNRYFFMGDCEPKIISFKEFKKILLINKTEKL